MQLYGLAALRFCQMRNNQQDNQTPNHKTTKPQNNRLRLEAYTEHSESNPGQSLGNIAYKKHKSCLEDSTMKCEFSKKTRQQSKQTPSRKNGTKRRWQSYQFAIAKLSRCNSIAFTS